MDPSTSFTVHIEGYLERINNLHNEYEALEDIESTLEQDYYFSISCWFVTQVNEELKKDDIPSHPPPPYHGQETGIKKSTSLCYKSLHSGHQCTWYNILSCVCRCQVHPSVVFKAYATANLHPVREV